MELQIKKWGNSAAIRMPKPFLEVLNLSENDILQATIHNGKVTLEPLSDKQRLKKKMGNKKWVKEFMSIPQEHRVNPFEMSPSGDLFYADKRNVDLIKEAFEEDEGKVHTMHPNETLDEFLNRTDDV